MHVVVAVVVLLISFSFIQCLPRQDVVVSGPTVEPNFQRPEDVGKNDLTYFAYVLSMGVTFAPCAPLT